jgi:recombination protein RecA
VRDFLVTNQPLAREIEGRLRELAGVPGRAAEKPEAIATKDDKADEKRHNEKRAHKVGV